MHARLLIIAAMLCTAASDVVIAPAGEPTAADLADITAQEARIIAEINTQGARQTIDQRAGGNLPPEAIEDLNNIDKGCGKIRSAERVSSKRVGSYYVMDSLVFVHERCLIKWDFTFVKENGAWTVRYFNFNTPDRGW